VGETGRSGRPYLSRRCADTATLRFRESLMRDL